MQENFSSHRRALIWRDLWIALAECQKDLGLDISGEQISALKNARECIDLDRVAALKARLWGKAQNFFEAAANSSQSATALAELSRLYLALGDQVKAAKVLERRVAELDGQLPDLPLP